MTFQFHLAYVAATSKVIAAKVGWQTASEPIRDPANVFSELGWPDM
jgi:hypothetical protein